MGSRVFRDKTTDGDGHALSRLERLFKKKMTVIDLFERNGSETAIEVVERVAGLHELYPSDHSRLSFEGWRQTEEAELIPGLFFTLLATSWFYQFLVRSTRKKLKQDREQGGGQSEPLGGVQRTAQTPSRRKSEHQVEGKRSRVDLICFIISLNFCLLSVVTYVNTK